MNTNHSIKVGVYGFNESIPVFLRGQYRSIEIVENFNSHEEFLEKYPPVKKTDNLLNAIKKAFNNRDKVTYNYGKGNVTFRFGE